MFFMLRSKIASHFSSLDCSWSSIEDSRRASSLSKDCRQSELLAIDLWRGCPPKAGPHLCPLRLTLINSWFIHMSPQIGWLSVPLCNACKVMQHRDIFRLTVKASDTSTCKQLLSRPVEGSCFAASSSDQSFPRNASAHPWIIHSNVQGIIDANLKMRNLDWSTQETWNLLPDLGLPMHNSR